MRNYITRDLLLGLQKAFTWATIGLSTVVTMLVLLHRWDSKYNMFTSDYLNYLSNEVLAGAGMWFTFASITLLLMFINNLQYIYSLVFEGKR